MILIHARHDLEERGLARAVEAEHADLGAGEEGKRNVLENLTLRGNDLPDAVHRENVLCHVFLQEFGEKSFSSAPGP